MRKRLQISRRKAEDVGNGVEMEQNSHSLIHYDAHSRRLWIRGQRCHHGATGALIAATAPLLARRLGAATLALMATGTVLMVDDWHDRAIWFQRGWQNQP